MKVIVNDVGSIPLGLVRTSAGGIVLGACSHFPALGCHFWQRFGRSRRRSLFARGHVEVGGLTLPGNT